MSDPSTVSETASIKTAHLQAEGLGASITFPDGVMTSRVIAKAQLASGAITALAFVTLMQRINTWEQTQGDNAKDPLRGTGVS